MRVAHFVHRYPPALGGAEAYFARLGRHLAAAGDAVSVFTSNALDLEAFWNSSARCLLPGIGTIDGVADQLTGGAGADTFEAEPYYSPLSPYFHPLNRDYPQDFHAAEGDGIVGMPTPVYTTS